MNAKLPKNKQEVCTLAHSCVSSSQFCFSSAGTLANFGLFGFSIIDDNHNRCLATHLLLRDRGSQHGAKRIFFGTKKSPVDFEIGGRTLIENTSLKLKKKSWGTGPPPLHLIEVKPSIFNVIYEPSQCT